MRWAPGPGAGENADTLRRPPHRPRRRRSPLPPSIAVRANGRKAGPVRRGFLPTGGFGVVLPARERARPRRVERATSRTGDKALPAMAPVGAVLLALTYCAALEGFLLPTGSGGGGTLPPDRQPLRTRGPRGLVRLVAGPGGKAPRTGFHRGASGGWRRPPGRTWPPSQDPMRTSLIR